MSSMPEPTPTPAPEPTPTPAPDPDPGAAPTPAPEPDPTPAPRTFSQADVDHLLARQKRVFLTGTADDRFSVPAELKELRDKASRFDELEAESKSELEKAQERAAELERQAAEASERERTALLRSAVVAEAARKNVVDPEAAFALLDRESLVLADDGSPTNIADAMDSLLKAKPYLVGGGRAAGSADLGARDGGPQPGQIPREQLRTMSPEAIVKAHEEGRLDAAARGDA